MGSLNAAHRAIKQQEHSDNNCQSGNTNHISSTRPWEGPSGGTSPQMYLTPLSNLKII